MLFANCSPTRCRTRAVSTMRSSRYAGVKAILMADDFHRQPIATDNGTVIKANLKSEARPHGTPVSGRAYSRCASHR